MATAGKTGSEEKWAHAAMEYIYEKNHVNDSRKRQSDVDQERSTAIAYDRYAAVQERVFEERLSKLMGRMTEALEALQKLNLSSCLEECLVLNTEQMPGNYRRPSLTPPLVGYESGFGLDVPQLRSQQAEYPTVHRPVDAIQYSPSSSGVALEDPEEAQEYKPAAAGGTAKTPVDPMDYSDVFPFVDAHQVQDLTKNYMERLEGWHGSIRAQVPLTGVEGEAWEAYVALQKKALQRQLLIFELSENVEFEERYNNDEAFRRAEWAKRGMSPLAVEADGNGMEEDWHYAQVPAYQPFRKA